MSESVLQEADRLINGDRQRDYGPPDADYARTVAIFNAWTGLHLTPTQGLQFMVAMKLSRFTQSPGLRDHLVDAAGYLGCLAKVEGHDQ